MQEREIQNVWGRRILGTDKVTFQSRPQGNEGDNHEYIWGKNTGNRKDKCKDPEGGILLHAVLSTAEDMRMNKLKELSI